MTPDEVEAVARRVVELLRGAAPSVGLVDTGTIAHMLGMSEDWVRDHAAELGAMRLGDGSRGELRFDVSVVRERIRARRVDPPPRGTGSRRPGPRPGRRNVQLLPLPDRWVQ